VTLGYLLVSIYDFKAVKAVAKGFQAFQVK
jgi:hypothetical protein